MPLGSSPRMRGKRGRRCQEDSRARLIPAHAGKTPWCRPIDPSFGAHPRACGENLVCTDCAVSCAGSSPRMRGKPFPLDFCGKTQGLIPAHAGKTSINVGLARQVWAHPRACGENLVCTDCAVSCAGSSPRMRGKPFPLDFCGKTQGLIPAHAGKTSINVGLARQVWAHPRACGENNRIT